MSSNPPLSLPNSRTPSRLASLVVAAALVLTAALAPSAQARRAKAPTLTIENKTCSIGAKKADRSVTVTALALLGDVGDRVTMRFTLQYRQGKKRWRTLPFKDPEQTRKWETTEAAGAGLKLTKTIPELDEGVHYRVVVQARAVSAAGKVATKTARKTVTCKQPQFTPSLAVTEAEDEIVDGVHQITAIVKNLGRLPWEDREVFSVVVDDQVGRQRLASVELPTTFEGNETKKVTLPIAACDGKVIVALNPLIQLALDGTSPPPADPYVRVDCAGTKASR